MERIQDETTTKAPKVEIEFEMISVKPAAEVAEAASMIKFKFAKDDERGARLSFDDGSGAFPDLGSGNQKFVAMRRLKYTISLDFRSV